MCPSHTPSHCVVDPWQSQQGQLVGVGRGGDVWWWRVREGEGGAEEEGDGGLVVEELAFLKKTDFVSQLRALSYCK